MNYCEKLSVNINKMSSFFINNKSVLCYIVLSFLCLFNLVNSQYTEPPEEVSVPSPVVKISDGELQGLERHTYGGKKFYSYKGIPFAEPPLGTLRFKDPLPAKPWSGVKKAVEDGNSCPQFDVVMGDIQGHEDCLYLNVFTPSLPAEGDKKYPVMVNIHSGGFAMGSGIEDNNNEDIFIENDVVVVSINYRLGIFGFLSLDIPEVPGNAAFKDQRLSLLWVKKNIHKFNGDPDNITLLGVSAGSTSVEFQLMHPESQGLFHKASMQSGAALCSWARPRSPAIVNDKLIKHLGINNEPRVILDHLQSLTTFEVLVAAIKSTDKELHRLGYVFTQFGPVVEKSFPNVDNFITEDLLDIYKSGKFVKVPTLRTFCRDEGAVFQFMYGELTDELMGRKYANFMSFLNVTNSDEINRRLTSLYKATGGTEMDQVHEFLSDLMFLSGIYESLKYMTRDEDIKHYAYMFSYIGNYTMNDDTRLAFGKVPHTIDTSYLLPNSLITRTQRDAKIANLMAQIFVGFVKTGDPTINGTLGWRPSNHDNQYTVLEIQEDDYKMIPFPFQDRMKYWDSLY